MTVRENVERWLRMLPKYRRTQRRMCEGDTYCCLGVGVKSLNPGQSMTDFMYLTQDNPMFNALLDDAREEAEWLYAEETDRLGLRDCLGKFSHRLQVAGYAVQYSSLTRLNDDPPREEWTHADTASFIRANWRAVFLEAYHEDLKTLFETEAARCE